MALNPGQQQPDLEGPDDALLDILVCPACHEPLQRRADVLVCSQCGRGFPIRDGIPVMLLDEAIPPEELKGRAPQQ
ncbi:MAG: Trm112 family protein [Candidatus Brocadiia bacterium]